ncbi:MAG: hypothetical protein KDH20_20525 [Rhodocyclaceae bacterium]|nr:hypothetical protein [Rhodocyclaceae bacterium]
MRDQQGFILPLLLALLFVGGLLYHFDAERLATDLERTRLERTRSALAEAREALIAHAITYDLTHAATNPRLGLLPCPDANGDGSADGACDGRDEASLGRLPYRTLSLPRILDGDGECLWYAVAGRIKNNLASDASLNWDTPGQFTLTGLTGADLLGGAPNRAVAVLIAPGKPLAGQIRGVGTAVCGSGSAAAGERTAYLEGTPAMATPAMLTIQQGDPRSATNNDVVAWITIDDIYDRASRMSTFGPYLGTITDAIAANHLAIPLPGPNGEALPTGDTGFIGPVGPVDAEDMARRYLDWQAMYHYLRCAPNGAGVIPQCMELAGAPCRAILAFGGRRTTGQTRPGTSLADYFEDATLDALTSAPHTFDGPTDWNPSAPEADILRCLN